MLNQISYYLIFGKPLIMYGGILVFLCLISTLVSGGLVMKGKLKFKYHKTFAIITICLALVHGTLGLLAYL